MDLLRRMLSCLSTRIENPERAGLAAESSEPGVSQPTAQEPQQQQPGKSNSNPDCGNANCTMRIQKLEKEVARLTSHCNTLFKRMEYNEKDLDGILNKLDNVTYSPNFVPEHRDRIPAHLFRETPVEENEIQSFSQDVVVVQNSTIIGNDNNTNVYNMNHKKRGKCIVFSHENFNNKDCDVRNCAENERKLLKETFSRLDFEVIIHIDFTFEQINKAIKELARKNYENNDCICFIILSHGEDNGLVWAKDCCYPISIFEDKLCQIDTLLGKPKIMFLQTCRGKKVDKGVNGNNLSDEEDYIFNPSNSPTRADFFIAHSTIPGHVSFREWFIPSLCKMLKQFSEVEDLNAIVTRVINEVCTYESVNDDKRKHKAKQVPCVNHTLGKKLFLKKK